MIPIKYNYAYELGVKTVLAGILALLLGLVGFVLSIFALGIVWFVPAMRTRTPPYRKSNPVYGGLKTPHDPVLTSFHGLIPQALSPIPLESKTPSLRRAASFPNLHKTPSSAERPFTTSRHVLLHVDAPEFYNPSLARSVSMNPSPIPPTIQRRWPHSPFFKRKLTYGGSIPFSRASSRGESNTVVCNDSPPKLKSPMRDLPLKCLDERCECHGRLNSMMNHPQMESLSEATTSTRSSLPVSLRLPSVRKPFSRKPRSASVPPRMAAVTTISAKEQSQKQKPTPESPSKRLQLSPTFSTLGEVYRAEYVNPFRMKKSQVKPKLEGLNPIRKSKLSFSAPWSSSKSAGLSPDADPSTSSTYSPPAFRRTFASRFTPSLKPPTTSSLSSSSTLELPAPSLSRSQVDVPQLKGTFTPRSVPRTQPYGPPWNAVMPGHGHDLADSNQDDILIKGSLRRRSQGTEGHGEFKSLSRTAPIGDSEGEHSSC